MLCSLRTRKAPISNDVRKIVRTPKMLEINCAGFCGEQKRHGQAKLEKIMSSNQLVTVSPTILLKSLSARPKAKTWRIGGKRKSK